MLPREMAQLQGLALASRAREPVVPLSVLMGHVEAVSLSLSTTPAAANALALTHGSADVQAAWGELFSPEESGIEPVPVFLPGETAQHASNDEINEVEQAVLLAQGIQTLPPEGLSLKEHLVQIERSLIEQALARAQGNVSQTARLLQLQRTTLIEKMNKYALRANA
jgi:sigma-54 specific flagellar transcriptional regulator A